MCQFPRGDMLVGCVLRDYKSMNADSIRIDASNVGELVKNCSVPIQYI